MKRALILLKSDEHEGKRREKFLLNEMFHCSQSVDPILFCDYKRPNAPNKKEEQYRKRSLCVGDFCFHHGYFSCSLFWQRQHRGTSKSKSQTSV